MKYIIILLGLIASSCGSQQVAPDPNTQTELIVEYNGVEVSRTGSRYIGQNKLNQLLKEKKEFVVIFSSNWCSACKITRKAIDRAGLKINVYYLNFDEKWVQKLAYMLNLKQMPFMIHLDKDGNTIAERLGPGKIVSYLLVKF